jgi:hypothetical protein
MHLKTAIVSALLVTIAWVSTATADVSKTYLPPKDYTGDLYVVVTVDGLHNWQPNFSIVCGPWIGTGSATSAASNKYALKFKKTQRDQVPFTVYAPDGSTFGPLAGGNYAGWGSSTITLNWRAR